MKKFFLLIFLTGFLTINTFAQLTRKEIHFPDINGYKTLVGDFHIHTVFSDGLVWPTVRVDEAWREGLDVLAMTDHIEYQPHKEYIPTNHNASYEVATEYAKQRNIILIRGAEVTRSMPPGHLNTIFINDASKLDIQDSIQALSEAKSQGGFIFWNHPGWDAPNGPKWYEVHTEIYEKGLMHGIEVVNWNEWYPEVMKWALEKNLTMLSNSDVHEPMEHYKASTGVKRRPLTLIFAKEKSDDGVEEALKSARTVCWFENRLIGKEEFMEPLVRNSLEISEPFLKNTGRKYVEIKNLSEVEFTLKNEEGDTIKIPPREKHIMAFGGGEQSRRFEVTNTWIGPEEHLEITLELP